MQNNCTESVKFSSLRGFTFSPSLAEGDKGGGLKAQNVSDAKCLNDESTHPLAPSAREGELNSAIRNTFAESNKNHTQILRNKCENRKI